MTYYGGNEMAASFRTVRKNTVQIAEEIPEDQYDFKASPLIPSISYIAAAPRELEVAVSPGLVGAVTVRGSEPLTIFVIVRM